MTRTPYTALGKEILTDNSHVHVADCATPDIAILIASLLNDHAQTQLSLAQRMGKAPPEERFVPEPMALYDPPPASGVGKIRERFAAHVNGAADTRRESRLAELDLVREALECAGNFDSNPPLASLQDAVERLLAVVSAMVRGA